MCRLTATELARLVRNRDLSALEVADAVLARLERLDPLVNAFCTPTPELARAAARDVDAAIAAGESPGPLCGVPVGIKDLVCTKGVRTVSGSPAYASFVPDEDDVVVERLKAAGALIIGKTNVPEFGFSGVSDNPVFPTTRNPWDLDRTPGGSSSGSGAAVAAGIGPLAIASDGGGSIRVPAAHCGVVGVKASMGRVPLYPGCRDERYPGVSSWETLEHIGPLARTVEDAALMLSVIGSGPDPRDRHSLPGPEFDWLACTEARAIGGLRVAYSADWGFAHVDPEVRRIVDEAVAVFERDLGCVVERVDPGFGDTIDAFWGIVAADCDLAGMRRLADEYGDTMSPHLVDFLAMNWSAEDLTNANVARKKLVNTMARFMRNYDLLLTPTLAVPPFDLGIQGPGTIDGYAVPAHAWLAFTFPFNLTGQPAASVPAGFTADGLPVGLQIVGSHLDDPGVLRAAAAFEQARPWHARWPDLEAVRDRGPGGG
ncbi:MAG: amidase [Gammaproteobacteria bacterium]